MDPKCERVTSAASGAENVEWKECTCGKAENALEKKRVDMKTNLAASK